MSMDLWQPRYNGSRKCTPSPHIVKQNCDVKAPPVHVLSISTLKIRVTMPDDLNLNTPTGLGEPQSSNDLTHYCLTGPFVVLFR